MFKTITTLAAVTLAAATFAPAVQAASNPDPIVVDRTNDYISVRVSGADLDFASGDGQQEMRRRVRTVAREVCEVAVPLGYVRLIKPRAVNDCKRDTREAAEPQLAALFARAASGEKVASIQLKLGRLAR